jgi:hypothetical protein
MAGETYHFVPSGNIGAATCQLGANTFIRDALPEMRRERRLIGSHSRLYGSGCRSFAKRSSACSRTNASARGSLIFLFRDQLQSRPQSAYHPALTPVPASRTPRKLPTTDYFSPL